MVSHQRIVNYAKALFEIRGSHDEIEQRQRHLSLVADLIKEYPEIQVLLGCPEVSVEKKLDALAQVLHEPLNLYVKNLLALIMKRHMNNSIRKISDEYHKLVIYSLKEIDAEVTTAQELTKQEKKVLAAKLEEKFQMKANVVETVDPSLLMGMTVVVHDQMIDLSAKGMFSNLNKQLMKAKI